MSEVFRPGFGRVLTVTIAAMCAAVLLAIVMHDGPAALLTAGPWLALIVGACWALFWRPEVVVEDGGVRVVNVFRTVDVPWPALRRVDTKWALTLFTEYGAITAWAAPAPGRRTAGRASRDELRRLPPAARTPDGIRPGDLPSSESGSAALIIRRRWEQLQAAGHLDDPRLEHSRVPVTWHWRSAAIGAVLLGLAVTGLLV